VSVTDRIDSALEKARWRKLELRGIYLDSADYAALAKQRTAEHRAAFGGRAKVWPLSYESVLLIGRSLLPVKAGKSSAVYATSGESIAVPKHLSAKTRLAA
jgi:hypothetical protein